MVAAQLHLIHGGRRAFDVDGDDAGSPRCRTEDTAAVAGSTTPNTKTVTRTPQLVRMPEV
ncbi:hypothetical protein ACFFGR_15190 [Arthrobacter liuii]|uniref:Uncharacterized protein n=1 Tax=Arthrobacter liuii TaxID=1476996 RepID=A0ABQ2AXR1_9MICC|nr:hypothetical protein [Arthrobacter liuii]GGI01499.1 hypothetical protein GCM10007170_41080 [Arthrobacter liuii]